MWYQQKSSTQQQSHVPTCMVHGWKHGSTRQEYRRTSGRKRAIVTKELYSSTGIVTKELYSLTYRINLLNSPNNCVCQDTTLSQANFLMLTHHILRCFQVEYLNIPLGKFLHSPSRFCASIFLGIASTSFWAFALGGRWIGIRWSYEGDRFWWVASSNYFNKSILLFYTWAREIRATSLLFASTTIGIR